MRILLSLLVGYCLYNIQQPNSFLSVIGFMILWGFSMVTIYTLILFLSYKDKK